MIAGRARAGCPVRNIQSTLDGLTRTRSALSDYDEDANDGPGLLVAVYEEGREDLTGGTAKVLTKLTQFCTNQ